MIPKLRRATERWLLYASDTGRVGYFATYRSKRLRAEGTDVHCDSIFTKRTHGFRRDYPRRLGGSRPESAAAGIAYSRNRRRRLFRRISCRRHRRAGERKAYRYFYALPGRSYKIWEAARDSADPKAT